MKKQGARKSLRFFMDNIIMISSLETKDECGCTEKIKAILEKHVKENCNNVQTKEIKKDEVSKSSSVADKEKIRKCIDTINKMETISVTKYKGGNFGNYAGKDTYVKKYEIVELLEKLL